MAAPQLPDDIMFPLFGALYPEGAFSASPALKCRLMLRVLGNTSTISSDTLDALKQLCDIVVASAVELSLSVNTAALTPSAELLLQVSPPRRPPPLLASAAPGPRSSQPLTMQPSRVATSLVATLMRMNPSARR
jgi:hypothetical protein